MDHRGYFLLIVGFSVQKRFPSSCLCCQCFGKHCSTLSHHTPVTIALRIQEARFTSRDKQLATAEYPLGTKGIVPRRFIRVNCELRHTICEGKINPYVAFKLNSFIFSKGNSPSLWFLC